MFKSTIVAAFLLVSSAAATQDGWVLRPDGYGPVSVGMSLPTLNRTLHTSFLQPQDPGEHDCFYVPLKGHSDVSLMILHGKVGRVDLGGATVPTVGGVRIGDTEARVHEVFPRDLKVEPSVYTGDVGGKYLTYQPHGGRYAIRFETSDGKVSSAYGGTLEAIRFVEGCS